MPIPFLSFGVTYTDYRTGLGSIHKIKIENFQREVDKCIVLGTKIVAIVGSTVHSYPFNFVNWEGDYITLMTKLGNGNIDAGKAKFNSYVWMPGEAHANNKPIIGVYLFDETDIFPKEEIYASVIKLRDISKKYTKAIGYIRQVVDSLAAKNNIGLFQAAQLNDIQYGYPLGTSKYTGCVGVSQIAARSSYFYVKNPDGTVEFKQELVKKYTQNQKDKAKGLDMYLSLFQNCTNGVNMKDYPDQFPGTVTDPEDGSIAYAGTPVDLAKKVFDGQNQVASPTIISAGVWSYDANDYVKSPEFKPALDHMIAKCAARP